MPVFVRRPRGRRQHQPRNITWMKLHESTAVDVTIQWGAGGSVSDDLALQWGTGGVVSRDLTLQWAILPGFTRIAYALTGRYGPVIARARFERRTHSNQFLSDVTSAFQRIRISGNNNRAVFRTASCQIDPGEAAIDPLEDHIAVLLDVEVDAATQTFQLGLFHLTHPTRIYTLEHGGQVKELWDVAANDVSIHLYEDGPGAPYVVSSGTNPLTGTNGVAAILDGLGLSHALPSTSATLPRDLAWPADVTWGEIVNDLLQGINLYSIKADEAGVMRTREAVDLATRTPDVTYVDGEFVLLPEIREESETTRFANKVIATSGNLVSVAINADPSSPTSTVVLGRTITRFISVEGAASQTALDEVAARYLREGSYLYKRVSLETLIDPRRSFNEVYALTLQGLFEDARYSVQEWEFEISPKSAPRMRHSVSKVEAVAVS